MSYLERENGARLAVFAVEKRVSLCLMCAYVFEEDWHVVQVGPHGHVGHAEGRARQPPIAGLCRRGGEGRLRTWVTRMLLGLALCSEEGCFGVSARVGAVVFTSPRSCSSLSRARFGWSSWVPLHVHISGGTV
jgi:hypothetical protein